MSFAFRHLKCLMPSLLLALVTSLVWAQSPNKPAEVGWIDSINGLPKYYIWLRGDKILTVGWALPIQQGDWIIVRNKTNQLPQDDDKQNNIILNFGAGKTHTLTYADTPYLVKPIGKPPTLAGNIMRSLRHPFMRRFHNYNTTQSMGNRGEDKLSMPLLESNQVFLLPGKHTLYLAWQGGKPPYQVYLSQQKKANPLQQATDISTNRVQFSALNLKTGAYVVKVVDVDKQEVKGYFRVLTQIPQMPKFFTPLEKSDVSSAVKETAFALWLMDTHKPWRLEAYQRMAALAESYYPALILREQLEK